MESMAAELNSLCCICLDTMDDVAHVMPCLHRFCLGCIRRWATMTGRCPLCRCRMTSILHSVCADDDFQEILIRRRRRQQQGAARQVSRWASIFRLQPGVLRPLLPWLRQELRQLFGADGRAACAARRLVVSGLRLFGLDEGALTLRLFSSLQSQAASFVRRLIVRAVQWCGAEVRHLLGVETPRDAAGQEGSPAAAPGAAASPQQGPEPSPRPCSSTGDSNTEELPVPTADAPCENPGDAFFENPSDAPSENYVDAPSENYVDAPSENPGVALFENPGNAPSENYVDASSEIPGVALFENPGDALSLERPYTSEHSWGKTYGEHKRHLEFSHDQYRELKKYAEEVGIFFTASGMDEGFPSVNLHISLQKQKDAYALDLCNLSVYFVPYAIGSGLI
ncbi:UNVERIFIED_CONTAM: hypothetical protein H355_013876 [Colinus virginianus]|nr:hypothetical protein H355_013876 [Colinus virginianus]